MTLSCQICSSPRLHALEQRLGVPILLNRLYATRDAARAVPLGRIDLVSCEDCGFTSNIAFDPDLIVYDEAYENDQAYSQAFAAHVEARARAVVQSISGDGPIDILEIGCGQAKFIAEMAQQAGARLRSAEGFDPAWRGEDGGGPPGVRIHKGYFTHAAASTLSHQPIAVVSRHTIEHVPQPLTFLQSIRDALGPGSCAKIFIETPCIAWILEKQAMQDFFYEHCSLFTADSLQTALNRAGFACRRVEHVFGGQYLWAEADAAPAADRTPLTGKGLGDLAGAYGIYQARWRAKLAQAKAEGPIAIWGAGAKGVTFALLIDPHGELIDHAIDINPGKQGRHLAGTGLRVLSPEMSLGRDPKTVVIMNPNYAGEIQTQAKALGLNARYLVLDEEGTS